MATPPPATRRVLLGAWAVAAGFLQACGGGDGRSLEGYCAELSREQAAMVLPVGSLDDIDATVGLYRRLAKRAPLAIQPQWTRLAALVQAAATVDINDPAARLTIIQRAYETERDANEIVAHAAERCGVALDVSGTTTTTLPPTTQPAPATTPPSTPPATSIVEAPVDPASTPAAPAVPAVDPSATPAETAATSPAPAEVPPTSAG